MTMASMRSPVLGSPVLGSVSTIWIASALTLDEAEQRHHQPLRMLAARMADEIERRGQPVHALNARPSSNILLRRSAKRSNGAPSMISWSTLMFK